MESSNQKENVNHPMIFMVFDIPVYRGHNFMLSKQTNESPQ
jgi:hypothetical protein